MSLGWEIFVIAATGLTLVGVIVFLVANWNIDEPVDAPDHSFDGIRELHNPLPLWWVGMFIGSVVFAGIYVVYYPALGNAPGIGDWTSVGQHEADSKRHADRFDPLYAALAEQPLEDLVNDGQALQIGRRLFINNCSTCHGVAATGSTGYPDLTDEEWLWGAGPELVEASIAGGRVGAMPPWSQALGDEGVADMVEHVLALSGGEHDPEAAQRGAAKYALLCVACHGPTGKGNSVLGAPDMTNSLWLYGGDRQALTASIADGRNGVMPGQADILGPERIRILAAYVMSLSP